MTSRSTSFATAASCHNTADKTGSPATVNSDPKVNTCAVNNLPGYLDQGESDNLKVSSEPNKNFTISFR